MSRRDADRCAFVSKDGRRCEERGFLEFHHVVPYAMGGETTIENIQLRCRAHNGYEADLYYGAGRHDDGGEVVREAPAHYGTELGPDRVPSKMDEGPRGTVTDYPGRTVIRCPGRRPAVYTNLSIRHRTGTTGAIEITADSVELE